MKSSAITRLNTQQADFYPQLDKILAWDEVSDKQVNDIVDEVLHEVKARGDEALLEYTQRFDRVSIDNPAGLKLDAARLQEALERIPADQLQALQNAAERITRYHERQTQDSWQYEEADGTVLGQKITPMRRVGVYVPGGKAAYPSTVLMNVLPAKVAGVDEVIMVVPTPDDEVNDLVLAAAAIAGVDMVFTVGGAQAVAALAYGTEMVPKVDIIVGPGNIFVATAKKNVYGVVGIDMIAGPSEILVICDGKTDPDWIAMDLFSQAEHDENAQSILISTDGEFLDRVSESIDCLLPTMPRAEIIGTSLANRGVLIRVDSLSEAALISNHIAPEHLELSIDDPQALLPEIRHAGAIFMGRYTAEALGDYCAGPNHVLPTSGTARFSSPLGVYDFQKRSSLIMCSADGASELGKIASVLAHGEGLQAHAKSAEYRIKS